MSCELSDSTRVWLSKLKLMGAEVSVSFTEDMAVIDVNMFNGSVFTPPDGIEVLRSISGGFSTVVLNTPVRFGQCCFSSCHSLKYIEVNEEVRLEFGGFSECKSLIRCDFKGNVERISSLTFGECPSLREVVGVENVLSIGNSAFDACKSLSRFEFGAKLATIGNAAFASSGLEEVDLSRCRLLTILQQRVFEYCDKLEVVKLSPNLEEICDCAFRGCTSLSDIEVGHVNRIGCYAFSACRCLHYIRTDARVIAEYAFSNSGLEVLELDEGVEQLEACFLQGTYVTELRIPSTLNFIEYDAFTYSSVKRVYLKRGSDKKLESNIRRHNIDIEYYD